MIRRVLYPQYPFVVGASDLSVVPIFLLILFLSSLLVVPLLLVYVVELVAVPLLS